MPVGTPELLLDGLMFPEGPRWHDGRLWFSDMEAHEVVAVDVDGGRQTIVRVPTQPSGLGWLPDGRMLVVSMTDRKVLRLEGEALVEHADLSGIATFHANDMVVDARGRAYVGNFGFDLNGGGAFAPARLALITPEGQARAVADELRFPNGMVITQDAKTLIVGESFGGRLTAFDIAEDGSLSGRRIWADIATPPDGICLDDEGCVWVAVPMAPGAFLRVAEGGEIRDRIDLDAGAAFACMLGGRAGKTLFLLEAQTSVPREMAPGNGRIRMIEVGAARAGWP